MRQVLARFFLFLAKALDPDCAVEPTSAALVEALVEAKPLQVLFEQEVVKTALPLVRYAESQFAEGTSGEFKRHWVYSQLLKAFPRHPKHEVALLLEHAVQAAKVERR